MASRGFYLVSAALLGGTALLVWLVVGRAPAPTDSSSAAPGAAPGDADGPALGVVAAEYDPARSPARGDPSVLVAERAAAPTIQPAAPRDRVADLAAPAPPIAGDPEPEGSAAAREEVTAAVRADLERRRDALRERCWPAGSDAAATFTFEATYAADGGLVALGVSDVFGMPGVSTCLMGQVGQDPPKLPRPPGLDVAVAVPLAFAGSEALPARPSPTLLEADK